MLEFLLFIIGIILGLGAGIVIGMKLMQTTQTQEKQNEVQSSEPEYKRLWSEAVNLLGFNGQLTPEQIASITPSVPQQTLSKLPGHSSDRRATEIARAQKGLPPADNLDGMHSSDIRAVHLARIQYGTAV